MRVRIKHLVMLMAALLAAALPVNALFGVGFMGGPVNIGAPYVVGPGFTFATPFAQGSILLEAFNSSALAHTATGAMAVSFPVTPGGGISPLIAQTTSEGILATESYFFTDFVTG